jgi:hypothetical protein
MCPNAPLAVVLAMFFLGCAAGTALPKWANLSLDCVAISRIDRWRVLDPYHVVVYATDRSAAYLVELRSYCQRLAQEPEHITVSAGTDGQLCSHADDALLVDDQRCVISAILPYKTSD